MPNLSKTDMREILSFGTPPGEEKKKSGEKNLAAKSESFLLEINVELNY